VTQKKLAQALTRTLLILPRVFASADQIANGFMRRLRNPDRRQITRTAAARQFLRIAAIRLDSVTALPGTNVGATTSHATPRALNCQYNTYPVGPAS
jgi:hypothetical protein